MEGRCISAGANGKRRCHERIAAQLKRLGSEERFEAEILSCLGACLVARCMPVLVILLKTTALVSVVHCPKEAKLMAFAGLAPRPGGVKTEEKLRTSTSK